MNAQPMQHDSAALKAGLRARPQQLLIGDERRISRQLT